MSEKVLAAFIGGFQGVDFSKPCGLLDDGCCVPLAATDATREVIEAICESDFANWFVLAEVPAPPTGGLWVAEFELELEPVVDSEDFEGEWDQMPVGVQWRMPTPEEMKALFVRQRTRAERSELDVTGCEPWVLGGALV